MQQARRVCERGYTPKNWMLAWVGSRVDATASCPVWRFRRQELAGFCNESNAITAQAHVSVRETAWRPRNTTTLCDSLAATQRFRSANSAISPILKARTPPHQHPARTMSEIEVPVISLEGFFGSDAAERSAVVAAVKEAALKCGFFMIKDHHANEKVIETAWKVRIRLFAPMHSSERRVDSRLVYHCRPPPRV